jgi:hypothetical protein
VGRLNLVYATDLQSLQVKICSWLELTSFQSRPLHRLIQLAVPEGSQLHNSDEMRQDVTKISAPRMLLASNLELCSFKKSPNPPWKLEAHLPIGSGERA